MTGNVPAARVAFDQLKKGGAPIACLTAYTAPIARLVDPHVDLILVGDSLGMVVYGFANTLSVTLDMMIAHGAAVVRNTVHALVVVDLPFGTYEDSPRRALESALRVMRETGCQAVKLEGGQEMAETVAHLVRHGIPVQGHIGLMPQSVEKMGGFKIQGRGPDSSAKVRADAEAIAAAGAFSIVIEGTVEPVARAITDSVAVPTIGIGASPACDGQILVVDDILGLVPKPPRFAKRYADVPALVTHAVTAYADDVRARRFPGPEHCFGDKA
ncbi:MAG TPA: 3-methyl-2-oxobutanoate hydroxymethyltransferase [Rhodopila sp.]|uniref:3-methyl-2-oxobutanoate hydroxymethyltransferase n=1 Tax=Rhodopila sp. TaxID=2480087 RepID=UPI002CFE1F2C|nr:3-methyl-2-oxobutanoate hydroxymethyltransferase [Rhodopila sp.]HVY15224.1 3-methyl-2-oxobutanoate hydroxymethyltransferase [Rhodopila sp.]